MGEPQHSAEDGRKAVWQPVDSAEVDHAKAPTGKQAEVARVRIRVQEPDSRRTREQETGDQGARPVPLGGRAAGDDPGDRNAVKPSADEHVVADSDHTRDENIRVAGVSGESLLGGSFLPDRGHGLAGCPPGSLRWVNPQHPGPQMSASHDQAVNPVLPGRGASIRSTLDKAFSKAGKQHIATDIPGLGR